MTLYEQKLTEQIQKAEALQQTCTKADVKAFRLLAEDILCMAKALSAVAE